VGETSSGPCPVAGFGVSDAEPLILLHSVIISKLETGNEAPS
jgi:hypothetical protein